MCGISGLFHLETLKPVDPARIRAMSDVQEHRGPDGSGIWTARGVGLGHRRLSIIDVSGSPQPMATHDGALTISFNGEIYNYAEIRNELKTLGHQFAKRFEDSNLSQQLARQHRRPLRRSGQL